MTAPEPLPSGAMMFETPEHLWAWLEAHHADRRELWVRIHKKASGTPSVTWDDCVVACLAWGWIDGQRKSLDAVSFLQRLTPRRPRSGWSARNVAIAERLIAEGTMQPSGLAQVRAAREDGRWARAYAGSAAMEMPADFLAALDTLPTARQAWDRLDRPGRFAIYLKLQTAATPETRARRLEKALALLERGEEGPPRSADRREGEE